MILDFELPSPNTVCVAIFQRSHAWQTLAAWRKLAIVPADGTRCTAVRSVLAFDPGASAFLDKRFMKPAHSVIDLSIAIDQPKPSAECGKVTHMNKLRITERTSGADRTVPEEILYLQFHD
jgi:hypothetical protein